MNTLFTQIHQLGIVPVVVLNDPKDALPLAEALCRGGLPCAEVTFRTDAATKSIRLMSEAYPDMLVGAGTVLTTDQVDQAVEAGARFVVSPGLNPRIVRYCVERNVPILPGCATPSDMEQALENGLKAVKFFPAQAAGGLAYIKAVAAPYTELQFMPTGGITPENVRDYLAYERILACGGSWMVKNSLIESGQFDQIEQLVKEAVQTVASVRG